MRILFWTEQFWPSIGGVEVRCRNLAKALVERGHTVTVITSHGSETLSDEDAVDGVSIHRFRFLTALSSRNLDVMASETRRLMAVKKKLSADIVHVFLTDPTVLFHWQTNNVAPGPTVIGIPIGIEGQQGGPDTLLHRTLSKADWIVAVSKAMLNDVQRLVPETIGKSSVILNSIDNPALAPSPLPFEPPRLLCLGRLVRDKGFDLAIDALTQIHEQFPGTRLVVAGDGTDRPALMEQARSLGIKDSIDFTGWVQPEDVPALINTCTAVIVPSRWREAFGNVVVQAMQMGRPVVASNVGGLPEIVTDGITGYLTQAEDTAALASAISRLLSEPGAASTMGLAGRERAASHFPFARHVDQHEELYRTIIDRNSKPQ